MDVRVKWQKVFKFILKVKEAVESHATPEKMQDVFELKPHVMGSSGDW
jgi:hypothetical protein